MPTKIHLVKAMVFPVVILWMWELHHEESERQRTDAFELWCWRRLLRVPWTARRSNQSIRKEISPEYSLEGLMLNLQYFGHLTQITDSPEKTLMLGKIEGGRRKGPWRVRWLDVTTNSIRHQFEQTPGVGDGVESCAVVHWVAKSWTWLSDWTDTSLANIYPYFWAISFPFILLNI